MACTRINKNLARELIGSVTAVLFDCDGKGTILPRPI